MKRLLIDVVLVLGLGRMACAGDGGWVVNGEPISPVEKQVVETREWAEESFQPTNPALTALSVVTGKTDAVRGFEAGLLTDTNALDQHVAGVAAGVSGTDKVRRAEVVAGDVAATNAAAAMAAERYVEKGGPVTSSYFKCTSSSIYIKADEGDPTEYGRIFNGTIGAYTWYLPSKDGSFAMLADLPSTAGMVTNGGAATLGAVSVTNLLINGNRPVTNLPSVAGMVTNGGAATLGAVSVTGLLINGNAPLTNATGATLVFQVNGFTQAVTLANSDTSAAPREVYGIELKGAGVVARDTYSGWDTGKAAFVVGPALAGKNLQVGFQTLYQGTGTRAANGFAMRRKVSFPAVQGALTNFPVLVKFAAGEYGRFQSAQGADLRFVDAAGAELAYEVETWNPAGYSFVWVRVPVLTNNAAVWAYWCKAGASVPAYTADGSSWSNFNLVAHLSQSNLLDSTALRYSADRNGMHTNAVGAVGAGRGFVRGDSIGWQPNFPATVGANMGGGFTVEAWVNKVDSGGTDGLLGMYHSGGWPYVDSIRINTDASDVPYIAVRRSGADADMTATAGGAFPLNKWVHIAGVFDGGYVTLYTNGVQAGKSGYSAGAVNLSAKSWFVGSYGDAEGYQNIRFTGTMDELRLSSVARGSNWVWATYRTVASNATWQVYGAPEAADGDWPGIFVNDQPVSAGRPFATDAAELGQMTAWVVAPTNGTRITFGARLKEYGGSMIFGGAGTGTAQQVWILAY